jgi:phage terminase Nu1 subunit (DNA packaging protein)
MREVSGSELAALTGRTWRIVKAALERAGVDPIRKKGPAHLFDSEVALRVIYLGDNRLDAAADELEGVDFSALIDQRQRLAAAQAEKVETDNAIRRGKVADLVEVEKFWSDCTANARAKLLAVPSKLSPRLVNIADAAIIGAGIRGEIVAALAELADYSPPSDDTERREPREPGSDRVEDMEPAADPDGFGMGGPGAPPIVGKRRGAGRLADGQGGVPARNNGRRRGSARKGNLGPKKRASRLDRDSK